MALTMTEPVFLRDEYTGAVVRDPLGTPIVIGVSLLSNLVHSHPLYTSSDCLRICSYNTGSTHPPISKLYGHTSHVIHLPGTTSLSKCNTNGGWSSFICYSSAASTASRLKLWIWVWTPGTGMLWWSRMLRRWFGRCGMLVSASLV